MIRIQNLQAEMQGVEEAAPESDTAVESEDASSERMDRVALLYGEITSATRRFLSAVAEWDRHRDWAVAGFGSCAQWLAWRIGITRGTANEKVRAARALEDLPLISEAMSHGEVSFSKVRALTRVATAKNETELLAFARACSAAKLERVLRGFQDLSRLDEQRRERVRHRQRRLTIVADGDGMYVVHGRLTPEVGAALMRAVEAASDALFAAEGRNEGCDAEPIEPHQRRADAMGLLAERAMAAGFGDDVPLSGSRAERYQVVLHVEAKTLKAEGEPGQSELEDGTRISAETARRLACDASRVTVSHGGTPEGTKDRTHEGTIDRTIEGMKDRTHESDRSVLDVGRKTRTVPPALRRALESRDRGCRFPGCGLRFTDAHHIKHWADGGETSLANTVLLCRRHHRSVHEEGYRICSDPSGQRIVFFRPNGKALFEAPPPMELPLDPVEQLVPRNRERGVAPDAWGTAPQWNRDSDVPWMIEAKAREALDPWDVPTDEASLGADDEASLAADDEASLASRPAATSVSAAIVGAPGVASGAPP